MQKPIPLDWCVFNLTALLRYGKDELPNAAEFYSDFVPPRDWSPVLSTIAWDSNQSLAIHAARLFLATSLAHGSNLLIDAEGRLYTIDFELCSAADGRDLGLLSAAIVPGTRAFHALRPVGKLSEDQVRGLFEGLPEMIPGGKPRWFTWPLGSKEKTAAHYVDRLRLWKQFFSA